MESYRTITDENEDTKSTGSHHSDMDGSSQTGSELGSNASSRVSTAKLNKEYNRDIE